MGANESVPVVCQVNWTPPILESIPWLLLAGVLWIERHRQRFNRWIVLALLIGFVALWVVAQFSFLPDSLVDVLEPAIRSIVFANAVMWLCSARIANPAPGATFLGMFTVAIVGGAAMLCASIDIYNFKVAMPSAILFLVLLSTTLVGYEATARCSQNKPQAARSISIFTLIVFALLVVSIALIMALADNRISWSLCIAISGGLTGGLSLGLTPAHLIMFLHPAQRIRLKELLNISEVYSS